MDALPQAGQPDVESPSVPAWRCARSRLGGLTPAQLVRNASSYEAPSARKKREKVIKRLSLMTNSNAFRGNEAKATQQERATLHAAIRDLALNSGTVRQEEVRQQPSAHAHLLAPPHRVGIPERRRSRL